ncbi:Endonuclease G [Schistosoma japonicum]|uniref:Endonuclease n=1 Tax=Schistosoma japonicum TaxID=6182 RepID=A0A4Z2DVP2_SCHJA|nr:Endonuclease G [Schistosoma japonicum]
MKSILYRIHGCWRKCEVLKAGVYMTVGAVITSYFVRKSGVSNTLFSQTVNAAEIINPPFIDVPNSPMNNEVVHTLGVPLPSHLRVFDGYICVYDRRNRVPYWVMEHLNPAKLNQDNIDEAGVGRENFDFYEDLGEIEMFRSTNKDYLNSGYDRGHLAAAGNHRLSYSAMEQTFILSNVAPQVGNGFNRHAWNSLEKYIRAIARKSHNMVVITGPLFLPKNMNGKKIVTYEVIGNNNVAVPTHFFKVAAIQSKPNGEWHKVAWVMPNISLPEKIRVDGFTTSVESVERASGWKFFPKLKS